MKALKVNIYISKEEILKKSILLSQTLRELRMELEKEIPNQIYFLKEGQLISIESEKSLFIKDILNERNSIYLLQEYIQFFIDDKNSGIEVNLFKKNPFKNYIKFYEEVLPTNFMIKCDSNLFIQINKNSIDYSILIEDILIENSINVFSFNNAKKLILKFISQNDDLGSFYKKDGNIIFNYIDFKRMKILDSLSLYDKYANFVNEYNDDIEARIKSEVEEKKEYKQRSPNEEKLEKIIYKSPKNIQEHKDEKSNLINFLESVINGNYDGYNEVNLIIEDFFYIDNNQKDIIKDTYINVPIFLNDNNIFFYYLRIKFYQCLRGSFGNYPNKFINFCKILVDKIKNSFQYNNKLNFI